MIRDELSLTRLRNKLTNFSNFLSLNINFVVM